MATARRRPRYFSAEEAREMVLSEAPVADSDSEEEMNASLDQLDHSPMRKMNYMYQSIMIKIMWIQKVIVQLEATT